MKRVLIILLCFPFIIGCGTFLARSGLRSEISDIPRFYPATNVDGGIIVGSFINEDWSPWPRRIGLFCLGLVDFPISIVTDTVCLPLDIWLYEPYEPSEPREYESQKSN